LHFCLNRCSRHITLLDDDPFSVGSPGWLRRFLLNVN
jgi:hypothetical protein